MCYSSVHLSVVVADDAPANLYNTSVRELPVSFNIENDNVHSEAGWIGWRVGGRSLGRFDKIGPIYVYGHCKDSGKMFSVQLNAQF